ncbi:hypothetical protein EON65_45110 [archaeon]|nr:MAG: hypothetical protein EON65_45110 [archaeon]
MFRLLLLFAAALCLYGVPVPEEPRLRLALVVTLAGNRKLADYFEWSCRSIQISADLVDMLVFHENNQKLRNVSCASNVKFINLGEKGIADTISKLIVFNETNDSVQRELSMVINNVLIHMPRYLVEVKPMTGSLFKSYLSGYSHWSYTDPDIIWGDLRDWIDLKDLRQFDVVSFAKNWDAGKLYLRGQMSWHQNTHKVNDLWRQLRYFSKAEYAMRLGNAYRMLLAHSSADAVFKKNFQSAEGYYSQAVLGTPGVDVKIVGRGFDDFFREPVVLYAGKLYRCQAKQNITGCISSVQQKYIHHFSPNGSSLLLLPSPKYIPFQAYYDEEHCKMHWLPPDTRLWYEITKLCEFIRIYPCGASFL